MFRIEKNMAPQYLLDKFTSRIDVSQRTTRSTSNQNFEIPRTKLEMSKRNFIYRGVNTWYLVPPELKIAKNSESFKCEIAKVWKRDGDVGVTYSLYGWNGMIADNRILAIDQSKESQVTMSSRLSGL